MIIFKVNGVCGGYDKKRRIICLKEGGDISGLATNEAAPLCMALGTDLGSIERAQPRSVLGLGSGVFGLGIPSSDK